MRSERGNRRRTFLGMGLAAGMAPLVESFGTAPDTARRMRRIAFINGSTFPTMTAAFQQELRALGWIEGSNVVVETRLLRPNANDLATVLAELAAMDIELVVAAALPIALEVRKALPTMPMVVATAAGLVTNGFAASFERPGGNVTGMDELPPGLTSRRLRLLKRAAPSVSRIALLSTTPGRGGHETQLEDARTAAGKLAVMVKPYRASSLPELKSALAAIAEDGMDGLLNFQGSLSLVNRDLIIEFAEMQRMPAMYQSRLFVVSGGLMALSPDQDEQFRNAARYVDKILKGARPGDLPIQHPARYELAVHTGAARRIGVTLPPDLLKEADEVL